MVGQPDAVDALVDRRDGVFDGGDALEDNGELGAGADLLVEIPLGVLVGAE